MAFADDLRKQTITDQQRTALWRDTILAGTEGYVASFHYACEQAAQSGERSCTLVLQHNYDDHIHEFYTADYGTAEEVCQYVKQSLQQDGFKKLNVSVERFIITESVERTVLKSLLGRYKSKKAIYYTLRIEAKW